MNIIMYHVIYKINIVIYVYYSDCATIESLALRGGPIHLIYGPRKYGVVLGRVFRQKVCLLRTHHSTYIV